MLVMFNQADQLFVNCAFNFFHRVNKTH